MNPALLALATFGIQELIKQSPQLYVAFSELFSKEAPTDADWEALRLKILAKSYKDYVPTTQLPDDQTK